MDSNLLKEAIADAKAVRQTALANAKVALEEAFTERYHEMFANKLKEETEQEEGVAAEEEMKTSDENVSESEIDELIKELEAEVGEEPGEVPHAEPDADDMPPTPGAPGAPGAPGVTPGVTPGAPGAPGVTPGAPGALGVTPGAPGAPQMVMCPVGSVATADMPPAPAVPGMSPTPVGGEVPPAPVGGEVPPAPETPPSDVPPTGDEEDEDVDLNELLETLKEEVEEGCEEEEEEGEKLDEQTKLSSSEIGGSSAGGSPNKKPTSASSSTSKLESGGDTDGMPTIDQPKTVAKEATQANRPNKATHATKDNLSTPSMGSGNASGGQSETGMPKTDQAKTTAKEATQASRPNQAKNATKDNLSTPGGMLKENEDLRRQNQESEEVIKYIKGQLNEVNLLNAKLLYTNKLFKEYNMNNEHKMRIVEMFDLAKNVREVKLTYANIAESLNFGGNDVKKKVKTNSNIQSITEGLASGAVGSTKPSGKQIITEASNMASRFQKLAGIKKPSK